MLCYRELYVKLSYNSEYIFFSSNKLYSLKYKKFIKPIIPNNGYLSYRFYLNDTRIVYLIHKMLGDYFIKNTNPLEYDIIDHINQNKLDNRIDNLRWVNSSINNRNQKLSILNTSGFQGVNFVKSRNSWKADWTDNEGKRHNKSFNLNKYNNAKDLAIEYRKQMVEKYYSRVY